MIVVDRFSKRFGSHTAVDDVSFDVPAGQVVAFLGPNGAGKTTTIRAVTGFHPPSAGRITVAGCDVLTESRRARRSLGYLPESTPLHPEMRVREYLRYRGRLHGLAGGALKAALDKAIDRCWLTDVDRRLIGQLSKGYRQRVGLAAALLHEPPVLILDEPTSGLDPTQIKATRTLMRELAGEHTMLLSTHILPEAQRVCDRVIIISRGRIRADGTPDELIEAHSAGGRTVAEVRPADEQAGPLQAALKPLGAVETERLSDGWLRLIVTPTAGDDPREAMAQVIREHGLPLRELRRHAPSLEEVFIQLTAAEEPTTAGAEGGAAA
jgi:ABC-2 type transport system ATP-binding protein